MQENKPSIIFIDDIDYIFRARDEGFHETIKRAKTEILFQMKEDENNNKNVIVIGATNQPWEINNAVIQKFERKIYIPLPDEISRKEIMKHCIGKTSHSLVEDEFVEISKNTDGYSWSDLATLTRDAVLNPLRKCQEATKFIKTEKGTFIPTYESDLDGVSMSLYDVEPSLLEVPLISMKDFQYALTRTKSTIDHSDLIKFEEWTEEFGQDV